MRLFNASVIPTLLYATETLNMSTEDERRLDAFQNKCIRKILHINWKQKKSNDSIWGVTKQLSIQEMLWKRRLRYHRHLSPMDMKRLPKLAMNWVPGNKRRCGRPPGCLLNVIEKDLKVLDPNLDLKTYEPIVQNRAQYRNLMIWLITSMICCCLLNIHVTFFSAGFEAHLVSIYSRISFTGLLRLSLVLT